MVAYIYYQSTKTIVVSPKASMCSFTYMSIADPTDLKSVL